MNISQYTNGIVISQAFANILSTDLQNLLMDDDPFSNVGRPSTSTSSGNQG
jgi:hypothetical protein